MIPDCNLFPGIFQKACNTDRTPTQSLSPIVIMKNQNFGSRGYCEITLPCNPPLEACGRRFAQYIFTLLLVFGFSLSVQALVFQGLTNTSSGNATIALTGSSMVVSNLGSSGQDGVSIAIPGNVSALDVHWQPLDPSSALPVGAYVQEQILGTANGVANSVLGTITMTKQCGTCSADNGSNYVVSADFSPIGASNYTVQAFRNGVLVAKTTNQPGASVAFCGIWGDSGCIPPIRPLPGGGWDWTNDAQATIAGQYVTCDRLYVIPENVSGSGAPTAFQITASRVPVITVNSENASLVFMGVTNHSLGTAAIAVSSNKLVISNLGSSGQDGVSIDLSPGNGFIGSWLPLDPSNALPVGAYVQSQMIGTAGTVVNGVLGSTLCAKAGTSNYLISVDYSPLGSSTRTVQVYNGSNLVAQMAGQSGSVCATVKLPPGSCTINPWLNQEWPNPTDITISGGPTVSGTEILMIPEGAESVSSISAEQITAANIPSITIIGEVVSPAALTSTYTLNLPPNIYSLIANQLDHGSNTADVLFPNSTESRDFDELVTYDCAGGYTVVLFDSSMPTGFADATDSFAVPPPYLPPGTGIFFYNTTGVGDSVTFTGTPHVPVLPVSLPCGYGSAYLLSRQTNDVGTYQNIIGLPPTQGAQVSTWTGSGFLTNTFMDGAWSLGEPSLAVGQAALIFIPGTNVLSYDVSIQAGYNLIANQLDHGSNTLNEIMPNVPDGSVLYKFNNAGSNFSIAYYSAGLGTWMPPAITLNPGDGAYFQAPTNFTLTFRGTPHVPVLPVTIPSGACYLLSRQTNDVGHYADLVGTPPSNDSVVYKFVGGGFAAYIYSQRAGAWSPSEPIAAVGEAEWISSPGAAGGGAGPVPPPPDPFVIFDGLLQQVIGNATVSLASSTLVVSNLGSSGQDGVTVTVGQAEGFTTVETFDPAAPLGAVTLTSFAAPGTGGASGPIAQDGIRRVTQGFSSIVDFSGLGSPTYTANVYDGGTLVMSASGLSGEVVDFAVSSPSQKRCKYTAIPPKATWRIGYADGSSEEASWTIPGVGTNVQGDWIEFTPDVMPTNPPPPVTQVNVTGANIPQIQILSESIQLFGSDEQGTGQALLQAQENPNILTVANLRTNGLDGVDIAMNESQGVAVNWLPLDPADALPVGAYLQSQAFGNAGSVSNGLLGSWTLTKAGTSNYMVTADFSPIGASTETVQVYNGNTLVASTIGLSGTLWV